MRDTRVQDHLSQGYEYAQGGEARFVNRKRAEAPIGNDSRALKCAANRLPVPARVMVLRAAEPSWIERGSTHVDLTTGSPA